MSALNTPFLTKDLFEQLPEALREPCMCMCSGQDREIFLLCALGIFSGITQKYSGLYNQADVYPNLYCYIADPNGYSYRAMQYINSYCQPLYDMFQQFALGNEYDQEPNYEPSKTSIPGSISLPSLMNILATRKGNAFILEPSGNIQYNDVFTKILNGAFTHQPLTLYHQQADKNILAAKPTLSVITSGSIELLNLLAGGSKGALFGKLCCYIAQPQEDDLNPFENGSITPDILRKYGERLEDLYLEITRLEGVQFTLTEEQQYQFYEYYKEVKQGIGELCGASNVNIANYRLTIAYRLTMVLTALYYIEEKKVFLEPVIICTDNALMVALALARCYDTHWQQLYLHPLLNTPVMTQQKRTGGPSKEEREKVYELFKNGTSLRKIATAVYNDENKHMKVKRLLKKYYNIH